jgi:hypothetical protein
MVVVLGEFDRDQPERRRDDADRTPLAFAGPAVRAVK